MPTWKSANRKPPLTIGVEQEGHRFSIRASGEVDFSNARLLQVALRRALDAEGSRVLIDLERVDRIDSSGLRLLLWAANRAREGGRRLRIRLGSSGVRRMLQQTGLDRALPLTG